MAPVDEALVDEELGDEEDGVATGRDAPRLLAAPDSFKGSCASTEAALAIEAGARRARWSCDRCAMSDGGEGFAEVVACRSTGLLDERKTAAQVAREAAARRGGSWQTTTVCGPLGDPVRARFWLDPPEAVLESAAASGLTLAGGASANEPLAATSRGTGELIAAAVAAGATRVLVGVGGSAMTDGGLGALEALEEAGLLDARARRVGFELEVACDVSTTFVDAAAEFAPQKGASSEQVAYLRERLVELASRYRRVYGSDVASVPGSGAAGGLAGGLAAVGARLVPGLDLVAERVGLERRIAAVDLVVTGEGRLDSSSWSGKVVGGVVQRARAASVATLVVAGATGPGGLPVPDGQSGKKAVTVRVVSLAERFGQTRAMAQPALCIEEAVAEFLDERART